MTEPGPDVMKWEKFRVVKVTVVGNHRNESDVIDFFFPSMFSEPKSVSGGISR